MTPGVGSGDDAGRRMSPVAVDITTYDPAVSVSAWWDDGSILRVDILIASQRVVIISGNPAGLISLARRLLTLAQATVPHGSHFDLELDCELQEGSMAVRIEVENE